MEQSLFMLFALVALTTYKKYKLSLLIGRGMIDCPEQFKPDVLFCNVA